VRTRKPNSHGRMNRYATQVSFSLKPANQRRAFEGLGAVFDRTATLAKAWRLLLDPAHLNRFGLPNGSPKRCRSLGEHSS
jgi:hypothetical protein